MLLYILGKGSYQEICYFTRILVGLLELCLPRSKSVLIWFSVIRDSYERISLYLLILSLILLRMVFQIINIKVIMYHSWITSPTTGFIFFFLS
jgi:hypothetical protein